MRKLKLIIGLFLSVVLLNTCMSVSAAEFTGSASLSATTTEASFESSLESADADAFDSVKLIIAGYLNDSYLGCEVKDYPGSGTHTFNFSDISDFSVALSDTVKIFLWDTASGCTPLCASASQENPEVGASTPIIWGNTIGNVSFTDL